MSENVVASEGGIGRKISPVDKLKINNQGGGDSLWVPEDNHNSGVLYVMENGIYIAANDGYSAYSEVRVRVEENLGLDDEWEEIDPTEEEFLWDDETLQDYEEDPEAFDEMFNDEEDWRDIEDSDINFELKDDDIKQEKITGTDPEDGDDYQYGVDSEGNLEQERLPSAIHIVVPPRKTKYADGETLDFAGIHVYLMDGNNKRYTSSAYPTGEIPFSQLIFPVTEAESKGEIVGPMEFPELTHTSDSASSGFRYNYHVQTLNGAKCLLTYDESSNQTVHFFASANSGVVGQSGSSINGSIYTMTASQSITRSGMTFYYVFNRFGGHGGSSELFVPHVGLSTAAVSDEDLVEMLIQYFDGTISGDNEIPVQWIRSDGKTLEDKFTIEVGQSEEGEDKPDPWANTYDFEYKGKRYNFNRKLAPGEIMYSNGTVYQTWIGGQSPPYTVEQAVSLGLVIPVGSGGHTSGGF